MKDALFTKQFKKDVKLAQKRGRDILKLKAIMTSLQEGHEWAGKHRDHALKGPFAGYRECHIEPDWLLIYKLETSRIHYVRMGTHSDLFG